MERKIFVQPELEIMTTVTKDSQKGEPGHAHICTKGNRCVLAVTIKLGSWTVAFTHWEIYRARAINIQLCGMA